MSHHRKANAPRMRQSGVSMTCSVRRIVWAVSISTERTRPGRATRRQAVTEARQEQEQGQNRDPDPTWQEAQKGVAGAGEDANPQAEPGQGESDHVDRAGEQEQDCRALRDPSPAAPPRSTSSQAPTAMLPAPPSETAAPKASSLSATRAPKRTGARSNTWRKATT